MTDMRKLIFTSLFALLTTGCAAYNTLSTDETNTPMLYGGTRLDLEAALYRNDPAKTFKVAPPTYHPLLDLPASFVLDTLMLPGTIATSFYAPRPFFGWFATAGK